jgi:membrane-associated phospholipid phosphatase
MPWAVVAVYGITLLVLLFTWNLHWIFFVLVPAVAVISCTVLRNVCNRPRPFERFHFSPLVPHGKGKSFPSRHTTSAVVIALGCWYLNPWYGAAMVLLSVVIGGTRVLTGVHHVEDVLVGGAISVFWGVLGFWLIAPLFGL